MATFTFGRFLTEEDPAGSLLAFPSLNGSNCAPWEKQASRLVVRLYSRVLPRWVQIIEYAKTPVFVRKTIAGRPCVEVVNEKVEPIGNLLRRTIFVPVACAGLSEIRVAKGARRSAAAPRSVARRDSFLSRLI